MTIPFAAPLHDAPLAYIMSDPKLITLRGRPIAGGKHPLICTPLVGATAEAITGELGAVLPKRPDIIEWRADFFGAIADTGAVLEMARRIKAAVGDLPVIFTCRAAREGGQPIARDEREIGALLGALAADRCVDLVDFEMSNREEHVRRVRDVTREHGVGLILSYHNFKATPPAAELAATFRQAETLGGDVAKVAVMPQNLHDVLTLLEATLAASETLTIPVLSMSMGGYGSLSRIVGWTFGSVLTFAVGQSSSAPGQIPIEDLRTALGIAQRALRGG